jgi:hypothetical protein
MSGGTDNLSDERVAIFIGVWRMLIGVVILIAGWTLSTTSLELIVAVVAGIAIIGVGGFSVWRRTTTTRRTNILITAAIAGTLLVLIL